MMSMKKNTKIHVLVVVRNPVGGIRTFFRYVYSQFDTQQYKFTFLLPKTSELDTLKENLKEIDCNFIVLGNGADVLSFIKAIFRILKTQDIDLIHSHGFTSMVYSVFPALAHNKPHLLTSHDVFTDKQFKGLKGFFKRVILGLCFYFVDIIHSVSFGAQDNLLSYFPRLRKRPLKLVVIPNGIEIKRFFIDEREDWRKQIDLGERTFLIGFFGRFMTQKGFRYLISAVDDILKMAKNDLYPVVLAFGWGGFIREEQAEIKRRGLEHNFHFLPFQESPARAIRGLDVIVMPSLWEAYGLLAAEALVAGVPIIGTNCIGLREVLHGTPARVVPMANSIALAEAIIEEHQKPSRDNFEKFRMSAMKRFDVKDRAKELEQLIHKLIQKL